MCGKLERPTQRKPAVYRKPKAGNSETELKPCAAAKDDDERKRKPVATDCEAAPLKPSKAAPAKTGTVWYNMSEDLRTEPVSLDEQPIRREDITMLQAAVGTKDALVKIALTTAAAAASPSAVTANSARE